MAATTAMDGGNGANFKDKLGHKEFSFMLVVLHYVSQPL